MGKKSVLIVDDEYDIISILEMVLSLEGMEVRTAFNGREALAILQKSGLPDLIITDGMMPVMNGYEFMRSLKAESATRTIPVMLISAAAPDLTQGVEGDWNIYFRKPFDLKRLMDKALELLGSTIASSHK